MQAITSLLSSLFSSSTDTADAAMQQRITILEQKVAKQKITNLILFVFVLVFGTVTIIGAVRKK